jgi:hypothetical protein
MPNGTKVREKKCNGKMCRKKGRDGIQMIGKFNYELGQFVPKFQPLSLVPKQYVQDVHI